ncbi:S8 family serine peptidase [Eubacterium oxidoreducens]|uniref:Serine protease, subtilisin family n=1 Tax=Eubacterium oxidoreducens TaxID=1732 RepID=A0A1G6BGG0_EUBOX|nr:S8 family serine peptidase [Eubacterium oxidoreducens]SDB19707.1 Serine protease, subtilisin family [Eubacterium oxidoreducens]
MSRTKGVKVGRVMAAVLAAALTVTGLPAGLVGTTSAGEVTAEAAETTTSCAIAFANARNYGGSYTDAFTKVVNTNDGGYAVIGYTMGDSTDPEWTYTPNGTSHSNNDALLLKYDANGNLEWTKIYGTTGVDVFEDITVLTDGRIAVTGRQSFTSSDSVIKGVSWYTLVVDADNPDSYTEYRIGSTKGDQSYGIEATSDGGFVVGGWSGGESGYITSTTDGETYTDTEQLWEYDTSETEDDGITNKTVAASESFIIKISKDGAVEYTTAYAARTENTIGGSSSGTKRLTGLTVDSNDDVLVTGYETLAKNITNGTVAKISGEDGSVLWSKMIGSAYDEDVTPSDKANYQKVEMFDQTVLLDGTYVVVGTATNDATTEEAWDVLGSQDTIIIHYAADGTLINSESYGTIDDENNRPGAVVADSNGGYYVVGSIDTVVEESSEIEKGYDWGNYGAQDSIIVKYNSLDEVEWTENYGTKNGDWINDMTITTAGDYVAVGESNGSYGEVAWGNNGGIDAIVMTTGSLADATETVDTTTDGDVTWQDGTYTASGDGYVGTGSVELKVVFENQTISSITTTSTTDTEEYYDMVDPDLMDLIISVQSTDVDGISGATYSSNGVKEAVSDAMSQAAAAYVDTLISAIESEDTAQIAADAYAELGSVALSYLTKLEALQTAASTYSITLQTRTEAAVITETQPTVSTETYDYNDTYYNLQNEYYEDINASALANNSLTGEDVKIAVIDSGLSAGHDDIDYSNVLDGYDYTTGAAMYVNPTDDQMAMYDDNGHGTAVVSILQATSNNSKGIAGLLSEAKIVPLKVEADDDSEESSAQIAQAIKDAVDTYGVDVITTSLDVMDTDTLEEAVDYAAEKNVIITAAVGNSSTSSSTGDDALIYPAAYDNVIGVGAVDSDSVVRTNSQKNKSVYVTAPGEEIVVAAPSEGAKMTISSGTSYSSPMVAAVAVAAKQVYADMTVEEFKTLLQETSKDLGSEGYDTSYGYGLINMKAVSKKLVSTVRYDVVGGTLVNSDEEVDVLNETEITLPKIKRSNCTFVGWEINDKWYAAGDTYTITEDTTFTAVWRTQITFDTNGGTMTEADTISAVTGVKITLPSASRSGYTFNGWKIGNKTYKAGASYTVTGPVTAVAQWANKTMTTISGITYKKSGNVAVVTKADKSLTKVTIASSVTINGKKYKVTKINSKVFAKHTKLKSVTIGANVKTIGSQAFFKATSLKKVIFKGKKVKSIGSKAFKKINKKVTYKYPSKKKKTAYQKLLKKAGAPNLS